MAEDNRCIRKDKYAEFSAAEKGGKGMALKIFI
jgi:hypothetical protein